MRVNEINYSPLRQSIKSKYIEILKIFKNIFNFIESQVKRWAGWILPPRDRAWQNMDDKNGDNLELQTLLSASEDKQNTDGSKQKGSTRLNGTVSVP